jgi:cytochrome c oxidase assembly factor CtaG
VTSLLPFRLHLEEIIVIVVAALWHRHVLASSRDKWRSLLAFAALALVTLWPVGDIAASVSLTAATLQRLVIMLLVAPVLLMTTPTSVLARLTRSRLVDPVSRFLCHPGVAIAVVTVLGTLTLSTPIVDWGARSSLGRDFTLIVVVFLGFVLWIPALAIMPGARRLSPMARAGYVFVSALVVTSLSFVWIFAKHPLYPSLHHQYAIFHMRPLLDQQLAGFVSKLGCYAPMWAVAFTIFSRADRAGLPYEETPLYWADVERGLLRADRQRARQMRHHSSD